MISWEIVSMLLDLACYHSCMCYAVCAGCTERHGDQAITPCPHCNMIRESSHMLRYVCRPVARLSSLTQQHTGSAAQICHEPRHCMSTAAHLTAQRQRSSCLPLTHSLQTTAGRPACCQCWASS